MHDLDPISLAIVAGLLGWFVVRCFMSMVHSIGHALMRRKSLLPFVGVDAPTGMRHANAREERQ